MLPILTLILPFFLIIGCGFFAAKIKVIESGALKSLNAFLLYFALPGMFISRLSDIDIARAFDWRLLVAFCLGNLAIWLVSTLVQRGIFARNLAEVAVLNTAAGWGNSGYMGIPLSVGLLGTVGLIHAFSLLAADILVLSTLAFLLHALHEQRGRVNPIHLGLEIARALLLNPFLIPFAIGGIISWYQLELPSILMTWAQMLGDSAFAVALFTIGAGMALRPLVISPASSGSLVYSSLLKLVAHPVLSGVIAWSLGLDGLAIAGIVVLTATPTATNAYILASRFSTREPEAAAIIFFTTLGSIVTLTTALFLLRSYLPGINPI